MAYSGIQFVHGAISRPPKKLSRSSSLKEACSHFTQVIEKAIETGDSPYGAFDGKTTSFSFHFYTAHDSQPLLQYHHTAPTLAEQSGNYKVDSDSIYRIGSITKLVTVFAFLIEDGDARFNEPITRYVPELREAAKQYDAASHPVDHVAWEDITIGALATHMAGVGRDLSLFSELTQKGIDGTKYGLPSSHNTEKIPQMATCTREKFFSWFTKRHPIFAPFTTPVYCNIAYQLLAYALENITGKTFSSILEDRILRPLNLSRTSFTQPLDTSGCVIPGDATTTLWDYDLGDENPSGSIYSTATDLTKLGQAILTSRLLSPAQTRRWLKPVAHTTNLNFSVGAAWEIYRVPLPDTQRAVDLYTKSGGIGSYTSLLILVPEFEVGFSILVAGEPTNRNVTILSNLVADILVPAFEVATGEEVQYGLVGTYSAKNSEGLESSITLATEPTASALKSLVITRWFHQGKDFLQVLSEILPPFFAKPVRAILQVTNLVEESNTKNGHTRVGYRAIFGRRQEPGEGGVFGHTLEWGGLDTVYWQGVGLDEFVLEFDEEAHCVSITPRALGVVLQKESASSG